MSTYWYIECLNHTPPLSSADEVEQHTRGLDPIRTLIESRPVDPNWHEHSSHLQYFETHADRLHPQHPDCRLQLVNEYGERDPIIYDPTTSAEPAPPTVLLVALNHDDARHWARTNPTGFTPTATITIRNPDIDPNLTVDRIELTEGARRNPATTAELRARVMAHLAPKGPTPRTPRPSPSSLSATSTTVTTAAPHTSSPAPAPPSSATSTAR